MQLILAILLLTSPANADESSGTWTGAVEARGNYYWETSTRVIAPEVNAELESPGGVRLNAHYLVDSITSASQAAGVRVDIRFTEVRHDFGLGTGYELDLGDAQLDLSANARFSYEPDYQSIGGSLGSTLSLNDRSTLVRFNVSYVHDIVGKILRGANRVGDDGRDLSDRGTIGLLDGLVLSTGVSQALSRNMTFDVGYDLGMTFGYLGNPYRMVNVDGVLQDEAHPDDRFRHTLHSRLAYYLEETGTAFHVLYRAYLDSWDIAALTPEARIYQELGDLVMLRARYRHYTQNKAFFASDSYSAADQLWTADPKMTEFHSNLVGGLVLVHLAFLEQSALDFAWRATLELGLEYIWNTNRYGNGLIGQVGLRIPF